MSETKKYAIEVIKSEAKAVERLVELLDDDFDRAVEAIISCKGKVVVTGLGKSGIIGKKIAATLASTGTPSFFLHPTEAYHGDLGMVEPKDVVLAFTNSGQTDEVLKLIPFFKGRKNIIISITGNPESILAKNSDYHLCIGGDVEACPLNLAPTSSTTAMLVMGDALAIALMKRRSFQPEDFALYHPGGNLGRRLLTKVKDVMREEVPIVSEKSLLGDAIIAISEARLGITTVVDSSGRLTGVITDGDIRRAMAKYGRDFFEVRAEDIMSKSPKTISSQELVTRAEEIMHNNKIHSLIVSDDGARVLGVVEYFNIS